VAGGIYLIREQGGMARLSETPYDSEALLQELLAQYPDLLAGEQISADVPRRWLLVRREAAVPDAEGGAGRWSVDHLFLDQDAVPTLVEVKRSSDTRLRREVVGQMLDYAANAVVYWPVEQVRAQFESQCEDRAGALEELLGADYDEEAFWQHVKLNLQAGRVRMLFVADEIPPELRRVVEFLNQQMDPAEVLAVQVRQFVGEGLRTLVPTLIGQSAEAQRKKSAGATRQWDEESFFAELRTREGEGAARAARQVLEWAREHELEVWWGRGARSGSFFPWFKSGGVDHWTVSVWTYGTIEVQFQQMRKVPPFSEEARREELRLRLNAITGVSIPADKIDKRPPIPLDVLQAPESMKQFLAALDWYVSEVRARG